MAFKYKDSILTELIRHGVMPRGDTLPETVHDYVNDLYLYEIRALRRKMRAGKIPKHDYANHIKQLRHRYPVLSLPIRYWTE
ncbi:MAG TPA: hypothetical protein VF762_15595 [Blastocatellia bacterium]|jgi:hypothetical protein